MVISRLLSSNIVKKLSLIMAGTMGAQLLTMSMSPIITRLYSAEVLGIFGGFSSIVAILIPVAALSYPMATILPKKDLHAIEIMVIVSLITLVFCSCLMGALFFFGSSLTDVLNLSEIDFIYVLLPFTIMSQVSYEALNYFLIRKGGYRISAKTMFIQSLFINSLKIFVGIYYNSVTGLIMITAFGFLVASIMISFSLKEHLVIKRVSINSLFNRAKEYKEYPFYRCPQGVIANINQAQVTILLMLLFGPIYAGYYAICRMALLFPVKFISKAINDVMMPYVNECMQKQSPLLTKLNKMTLAIGSAGLLPLVIVILFGPELFAFVFGEEWYQAGIYARWVSPWLYFMCVNRVYVAAVPALKLEKLLLYNSIFNLVVGVLAFYSGWYFYNSALVSVALYSLVSILPQIIIICVVHNKVKLYECSLL